MKEFIDKLIAKLEERQDKYAFIKSEDDYALGEFNACEYAINTINELAEEHINCDASSDMEKLVEAKEYCSEYSDCSECTFSQIQDRCILAELQIKGGNNGWIACSERLPEESNDYLVTQYNENAIDDYCDGYRVSTIFFDDKNGWWDDIDDMFGWSIIAWQPRPDTYKEGE
jgi:hypothetical protein